MVAWQRVSRIEPYLRQSCWGRAAVAEFGSARRLTASGTSAFAEWSPRGSAPRPMMRWHFMTINQPVAAVVGYEARLIEPRKSLNNNGSVRRLTTDGVGP